MVRILSKCWLVALGIASVLSILWVVVGEARRMTSTEKPTVTNALVYTEHGHVLYARPILVNAHSLLVKAVPFFWFFVLVFGAVIAIAGNTTSAVGRRWTSKERRRLMTRQPNIFRLWWWQRRIERMKRCSTADELIRCCGQPAHRVDVPKMSIWHYPLHVIGGTFYSIHVAVIDGTPKQVYLAMEPTTEPMEM